MIDATIKRGQTSPLLAVNLSDANGTVPLDLATAVRFHLADAITKGRVIDAPATIASPPSLGQVVYAWKASDTRALTAGVYLGEFVVTWTDATTQYFPADPEHPYLLIQIQDALA